MAITRDQLEATLAVHDADALRLILHASDVDTRGAETPAALAARIADAVWWNYSTPLGYLAERATFEDIVRHLTRKLGASDRVDPDTSVWEQVASLTEALVSEIPAEGISIESLDENSRKRLFPSWGAPIGYGTGASSSFVTRWGAGRVLALLKTPIGRLLPLLPVVGPWVGAIRTGIGAVHLVSGPLGVALAVMSLNSALGTNYQRLVPLVLGIGALGPDPVFDAEIVKDQKAESKPAPAESSTVATESQESRDEPEGSVVSMTDIDLESIADEIVSTSEPLPPRTEHKEEPETPPVLQSPEGIERASLPEEIAASDEPLASSPNREESSDADPSDPQSIDLHSEETTTVIASAASPDPEEGSASDPEGT